MIFSSAAFKTSHALDSANVKSLEEITNKITTSANNIAAAMSRGKPDNLEAAAKSISELSAAMSKGDPNNLKYLAESLSQLAGVLGKGDPNNMKSLAESITNAATAITTASAAIQKAKLETSISELSRGALVTTSANLKAAAEHIAKITNPDIDNCKKAAAVCVATTSALSMVVSGPTCCSCCCFAASACYAAPEEVADCIDGVKKLLSNTMKRS